MRSLDERIRNFLSTLRLGIDFGEAAGGISLVQDNTIHHTETYLEFRDATLKDRRTLRRGRRTRHAKKMRLARLRSWILRQFLPFHFPGAEKFRGKCRLPDPYRLMAQKKYQTLPGFFGIKGNSPRNAPTWTEEAKRGNVDAEGFVIALTHVFQKRGYKYYDTDSFEEYNDSSLIAFLNSCCMLREDQQLMSALEQEIPRRKASKKNKKIEKLEQSANSDRDLDVVFKAALDRPQQKKKALPRVIREKDIEEMVNAFCRRYGLDCAAQWIKELTRLLNKVVRPARFNNRVKSGCSWCGKNTPRLKKTEVRRKNLMAAVNNLRAEVDRRLRLSRPLEEEEKKAFLNWFDNRQKERQGRHVFVPRAREISERAPSRENIEKYLEQIGAKKSWDQKKKKNIFPMLPQLDQLINGTESSKGRAKLCAQCVEFAAQGKIMKDAGVEWQSMRKREARNPKREQHDARVLKRIEDILFHKGKKGVSAWKHGPVAFITIETPKPRDPERAKKGEQKEKKTLSLRERLLAETDGKCMYCDSLLEPTPESVEIEHIYPKSKGGPNVQLNYASSCKTCNGKHKDNMLPSEFLKGKEWDVFRARVENLKTIPEFKRGLLLLPPGSPYPDDPTPLARSGARVNQFIQELQELFERHGVEPPTKNHQDGKPHVQVVEGGWTHRLRRSWLFSDVEGKTPNFPDKNRGDLFNHAQDAALIAATPPHTWRLRIFNTKAVRPCFGGERKERPDTADLRLAPDWRGFHENRKAPIVRTLGNLRISWKRSLTDWSFYQDPEDIQCAKLKIRKPKEDGTSQTIQVRKGGMLIQIPHHDGTSGIRKTQIKPYQADSIIIWHDPEGKAKNVNLSLRRPRALRKLLEFNKAPLIDPPIPESAIILRELRRQETITLPKGFFRVKELSKKPPIILIPEDALPEVIRRKMNLPEGDIRPCEWKVGKAELWKLFGPKEKQDAGN